MARSTGRSSPAAEANLYDDRYETCRETFVTLRISGGIEDPFTVGDRLELSPTSVLQFGKLGTWRDGECKQGNEARFNSWSLTTKSTVDSRDSGRHLDYLLNLLEGKNQALSQLRAEGWTTEIVVFWDSQFGHGGPSLNPSTMRRLADLELSLWFDVYTSEAEELE